MSEEAKSTRSRVTPMDMAQKVAGGNKIFGVIMAILMIVVGILIMNAPIITFITIEYLAMIGFIIYGIYNIITYVKIAKEARNGWMLANGIIFVVLGVLLVSSNITSVTMTFAFMLGFLALFGGISQMASAGMVETGKGWVIASGIINLLLGIFMIAMPFAGLLALEWILSIYLIVGGIGLLILALSSGGKK